MTAYRLHYFLESGNSYKLALMLALHKATREPINGCPSSTGFFMLPGGTNATCWSG